MAWMRAAFAFMMLSAVSLPHYSAYDLSRLNISGIFGYLLRKVKGAAYGNENAHAIYHQLQSAVAAVVTVGKDVTGKASQDLKSLLATITAAITYETKIIIAMLAPYISLIEKYWQTQNSQTQAALFFVIAVIVILSLVKARLPSIFLGEDWGRYTSELDIKTRCIEPLLKNLKINYVSDRPCKFRQGHVTCEGKIDFYLYDDKGPVTIIEDKATIEDDEDLRSARAQARSYCLGLYTFENLIVNSFVIASKEGLKIYRIKHNEDLLLEEMSPDKLNRSRKRWIKEKLLEIR